MTLVVVNTELHEEGFRATWQCDARGGELFTPRLSCRHPRLAAELLALSHLVVSQHVVGVDAGTAPVEFRVSCADLPLAVQEAHTFGDLGIRLRSRALRARFADATFVVGGWKPQLPSRPTRARLDGEPIDWRLKVAGMPGIVLTEHAVRRVFERHGYANLGYAFRHIHRWAKHDLHDAVLPDAVRTEKLLRYGSMGRIVANDAGWHGIIVNNTLVTMFYRKS